VVDEGKKKNSVKNVEDEQFRERISVEGDGVSV
jgi:hypothetical protein